MKASELIGGKGANDTKEFIRGLRLDPNELTPIEKASYLTGISIDELRKTSKYVIKASSITRR